MLLPAIDQYVGEGAIHRVTNQKKTHGVHLLKL